MFFNSNKSQQHRYQKRSNYYYSSTNPSYTQRHNSPRRTTILMPIIVLALIGSGVFFGWQKIIRPLWAGSTDAQGSAVVEEQEKIPELPPEPIIPTITKEEMDAQINTVIAQNPSISIGVAVVNLDTDETTLYGDTEPFLAASTAKVLTAAHILSRIESGAMSLSQIIGSKSVSTHLELMIEQSDNASWKTLDGYTTYPALQTYARSIGMADYTANNNSMSAGSMALLLQKLYHRELVNETNTNLILNHMSRANRTDLALPALPDEATVFHKAGWLDDRTHDAVIVKNDNTPYVLVIYAKGYNSADLAQRITLTQQITAATVDHFISTEAIARSEATALPTNETTPEMTE